MPNNETAAVGGSSPAREQGAQPDQDAPAGSRWRMRNWPLRSKLAVVLIVPLLTAMTFGGIQAIDEAGHAGDIHHTIDQLDVGSRVTSVVNELQAERSLAVARMAGGDVSTSALDEQFGEVDTAVRNLRTAWQSFEPRDEQVRTRYERALERLDALGPLRDNITDTPFPDLFAFQTYNSILGQLVQLGRDGHVAATDQELMREGMTLHSLTEAKEWVARQAAALQIAVGRGGFPADLLEQTFAAQASADAAVASFNASADLQERDLYAGTVAGPEVDGWERIVATAFAQAQNGVPLNVDGRALSNDSSDTLAKLYEVETGLLDGMRATADDLASDATVAAWVFGAIVLLALIATLVLMLMVARALLRPLKLLRSSALDVAYVRLPETVSRILADPNPVEASQNAMAPVPVDSRDEIGEVARSFDVVNQRAVRMAAEQALLRENVNGIFVNLSRRSQRLVESQLSVIDRLESDEQDPDQLASLFELDHLATRLRRNGESLLVLSGAGLTKPMSKPVPAGDVIGAAVSEIEQYSRVDVGTIPDVAVHGRTVHDLVHLMAELLDNATYFSEPQTRISVRAVVTRRNSLAVQIADNGVGMSEAQLIEANERLSDPPDLDVSVTRRMGLYVVARLAKRQGIEVRLRENDDLEGGVVARVVVPPQLLTGVPADGESLPTAMPPQPRQPTDMFTAAPPVSPLQDSLPSWPDLQNSSPSLPSMPSMPSWPSFDSSASLPPVPDSPASLPPVNANPLDGANDRTTYIPHPNAQQPPPPAQPPQAQPPAQPQAQQQPQAQAEPDSNGLTPLDQPISLDDLVGGPGKAAGPFLSPAASEPPPAPPQRQAQAGSPRAEPAGQAPAGGAEAGYPLELPKHEPQYRPVTPERPAEPEPRGGDGSALDSFDDSPTKRLPIYQSVVSRWFSADAEQDDSEPEADAVAPQAAGAAEPRDGWYSASDQGWEAAHALLEPKGEEVTPAGLPKRVPNAYLVPGSIQSPQPQAAAEAPSPAAEPVPVARSAEAARNRMKSFQRGYQSGRHALRETSDGEARSDEMTPMSNGFTNRHVDNGTKE